jgi:hypothetical protein
LDKVLYTIQSIISSSSPSALSSPLLPVVSSRTLLAVVPALAPLSPVSPLSAAVISAFPAFGSLLLPCGPGLLGEEVALDGEGSVIAGVLLLLGSGIPGEGDFEDGEESLLPDGDESLLSGLIDINNLLLSDVDDLVQSLHLPPYHFRDPEGLVHELLSSLDGHEGFALSEEERECAADVATWVRWCVP